MTYVLNFISMSVTEMQNHISGGQHTVVGTPQSLQFATPTQTPLTLVVLINFSPYTPYIKETKDMEVEDGFAPDAPAGGDPL